MCEIRLSATNRKKGRVLSWSIDKCGHASRVCSDLCYGKKGGHRFCEDRHRANTLATESPDFVEAMCAVLEAMTAVDKSACLCLHERGDFFDLAYLKKWVQILRAMKVRRPLLWCYAYTRAWCVSNLYEVLKEIGEDGSCNLRVNLSTDRSDYVGGAEPPERIGNGLVTFLMADRDDVPPSGVDLVFRNRHPREGGKGVRSGRYWRPQETIGGALICPAEDLVHRVKCDRCRLCIDASRATWERIADRFLLAGHRGEGDGHGVVPVATSDSPDEEGATPYTSGIHVLTAPPAAVEDGSGLMPRGTA